MHAQRITGQEVMGAPGGWIRHYGCGGGRWLWVGSGSTGLMDQVSPAAGPGGTGRIEGTEMQRCGIGRSGWGGSRDRASGQPRAAEERGGSCRLNLACCLFE